MRFFPHCYFFACAFLVVLLPDLAAGQASSPSFTLLTNRIGAGGQVASSASFYQDGAHGQGLIGTSESTTFRQHLGFIPMARIIENTAQNVIHVDQSATGANNGTSWSDAYVHLQDALDEVNADPDTEYEIRVAEGVYFPDEDSDGDHTDGDENERFLIDRDGLTLLGGYPSGGGTREVTAHATVLSGDIDDNDTKNSDGVTENASDISGANSNHVLRLNGDFSSPSLTNTRIDGVTITGGQADGGTAEDQNGAGVFVHRGSPIFVRVVLAGNRAESLGGGMYNMGNLSTASPTLVNLTFSGNSAASGGGVYNNGKSGISRPDITNTLFTGNTAAAGGAMYNDGVGGEAAPELTNVTFAGNTTDGDAGLAGGGALFNNANSGGIAEPILANCILWGNQATGSGDGDQIKNLETGATPAIGYSILEGGLAAVSENSGSSTADFGTLLDENPQFVDADGSDNISGTGDDDLRLQGPGSGGGASPAIDAGSSNELPNDVTDLDGDGNTSEVLPIDRKGNPRVQNGANAATVDMGMFESSGSPLPVELTRFTARTRDEAIRLAWRTASETQNAGFAVERTTATGGAWTRIGFVEGHGTTATPQSYAFTDANPPYAADVLHYRLKQVDLDGGFTYSPVVEVALTRPDEVALQGNFPNPFAGQTTIRYSLPSDGSVDLHVFDPLGRKVATLVDGKKVAGQHHVQFDAHTLTSGVYLLRLSAHGTTQTQKMTVVR